MDGEARIDEQYGILARGALAGDDKRAERTGNRSGRRDTPFGRYVDIDKSLDKSGGLLLEFGDSFGCRIYGGDSGVQGGFFGIESDFAGAQPRYALIHPDEGDPGALFEGRSEQRSLSDRSFGQIGNFQLVDN